MVDENKLSSAEQNGKNRLPDDDMPGPEDDAAGLRLTKRSLYASEESAELKNRQEELHRLGVTRHSPHDLEETDDTLAATKYRNLSLLRAKRTAKMLRFSGLMLAIIFLILWGVVAFVWYRARETVTQEQVGLTIAAPQTFTSGEEIIYQIAYKNNSLVNWQNVNLVFYYPHGFVFRGTNQVAANSSGPQTILDVGNLAAGQGGELHVRGQLIGELNETATASADIIVTPENFPSGRFKKTAVLATNITALPLGLNLDIPKDAASSERILGQVSIVNLSNQPLTNVYVKLEPSANIELVPKDNDFSPGFSDASSQWHIGSLAPLESHTFTVVFYVQGKPGETRNFDFETGVEQNGEIFTQRRLTQVVTVSASEVLIQQMLNGSADPIVVQAGDVVKGEVQYNNVGTVGLKDAIVKVSFEGIGFDPRSLQLTGGFYDSKTKTATWSSATIPELGVVQPKTSGAISYTYQVLPVSEYPPAGSGSKDNVIVSVASFDSPDIPTPVGGSKQVISDRSVASIKTSLKLDATALYDDGRLGLKSAGPLPPRVGQTTTYTVRFRIGTMLNDVSDIRLLAVLPDGVTYTGQSYKTGGEISFNERTGELLWSLPLVEGGTGRVKPPQELHIQVAITPGEDLKGKSVAFLNKAQVEAVDQFVDEAVTNSLIDFPGTDTAAPNAGTVQ